MHRPSPRARILSSLVMTAAVLAAGCGSKISEANYFRVRYGMTEEEVEELLGPAHEESAEPMTGPPPAAASRPVSRPGARAAAVSAASSRPASTRPALRKFKAWSRDGITIRVVFEYGVVTGRSAEGITADPPSTRPSVPVGPPAVVGAAGWAPR